MKKATFGNLRKMEKVAKKPAGQVETEAGEGSMEALALLLWAAELSGRPDLTFDAFGAEVDALTVEELMAKYRGETVVDD